MMSAALIVTAVGGCGSAEEEIPAATAHLSGSVAIVGKPVNTGSVHFYSLVNNISGQASLDKTGRFQLEAPLPPGEYTVYLSGVSRIPERFLSETSSGYRVSIDKSDNKVAIDLK
ncbi:MAG: hypothetical protein ACF788_10250 [Novipirellula sp. JB048]